MKLLVLSGLALLMNVATASSLPPDLDKFVRRGDFEQIKISPDGKHYAITAPTDDGSALIVLDAATQKPVSSFRGGKKSHIDKFWWANSNRLLLSMAEKAGSLDQPVPTGELYATNIDGSGRDLLFGFRAESETTGSHLNKHRQENASAFLIDDLPNDADNVLIAVWPWSDSRHSPEPFTRIERMDVVSGRRVPVGRAPVRGASFLTDRAGHVRFAFGLKQDNLSQLYYRTDDNADWVLLNDQGVSGRSMWPLAFNADDSAAYVEATEQQGPNSIQLFDVAKHGMSEVLRDKKVDPHAMVYAPDGRTAIGAIFMDGKPRTTYFDPAMPAARVQRSLAAGFPDTFVVPISSTSDGKLTLFESYSDRNTGDIYLFDSDKHDAKLLISRRQWLDPREMAERKPIELKARDGLVLHGYLTLPRGSDGKAAPLVVYPHGGPFKVMDTWGFDTDAQMLAAHGYAVLQVNFRGSANYGAAFESAGYKQWGRAMQDDLTDATRWAIESDAADKNRICIYGASYGAYAALMGVAKEPTLYRCAIGYVGVYDLDMMFKRGDIAQRETGINFLRTTLGTDDLAANSPVGLAERIKVPVFLAAGGEDPRAPLDQTQAMEAALKKAGRSVETLVYPGEAHGFYDPAHVGEFDKRLLDFLDKNIGKDAKAAAAP